MKGLHLDLKWSMPKREYIEAIIVQASTLGIDTILFEFENKLMIDWLKPAIHPEHWTLTDLYWFLKLTKRHKMTVIPMVPLMGHMEWILQWPWWQHMQENHDRMEICPSHPEAANFVKRLLQTVLDIFKDSPMIHIGGDETASLGSCPRCRATNKTKGQIYMEHYTPLIKQVESAGKRALIYSDMFCAYPDALNEILKSVIIIDWDYLLLLDLAQNIILMRSGQ